MLASLSTWQGRPSASRIRSAIGRSRQARLGAKRRTPSFASTSPAAPTPIAVTSGVVSDRASSTIVDSVAASSSARVGELERSTIVPSRVTRNALILVPPTSSPIASPLPRSGTSEPLRWNGPAASRDLDPLEVLGAVRALLDPAHVIPAHVDHGPRREEELAGGGEQVLEHVGRRALPRGHRHADRAERHGAHGRLRLGTRRRPRGAVALGGRVARFGLRHLQLLPLGAAAGADPGCRANTISR